jgi:hypothetical protein
VTSLKVPFEGVKSSDQLNLSFENSADSSFDVKWKVFIAGDPARVAAECYLSETLVLTWKKDLNKVIVRQTPVLIGVEEL